MKNAKKLFLISFLILGFSLLNPAIANAAITDGLPADIGGYSNLTVFNFSGGSNPYLITGEGNINSLSFDAFQWNGTSWTDSTVDSGLPNSIDFSHPAIVTMGGRWHLITGKDDGTFEGFDRIGGAAPWVASTIENGLNPVGGNYSTPTIFPKDGFSTFPAGSKYVITGKDDGTFDGYRCGGAGWVVSTIADSLPDVGSNSNITVFKMGTNANWYAITGDQTGQWNSFRWSNGTWIIDTVINNGLPSGYFNTAPEVFNIGTTHYLIFGEKDGRFFGFHWDPVEQTWVAEGSGGGSAYNEYSVAVILAEPNDVDHISYLVTEQPCKLIPEKTYPDGHGKEYYQDLAYCVADYHKENSFGTVDLNFEIFDGGGGWFELTENEDYYVWYESEFVKDAIGSATDQGIDLSGKDLIIGVWAGNKNEGYQTIIINNIAGEIIVDFSKVTVGEKSPVGVWAHEIGHFIGSSITPKNTSTPDLYKMGNVGKWDLMARGAWNGGGIFRDGSNPCYMSSFTKEFLKWLNYDIHPKSAYGEYWINSLETSNFGDSVFRYNLSNDTNDKSEKYYILETRNRNLRTWDSSLPGLLADEHLVLYYVDSKEFSKYDYDFDNGKMIVENWIINIPGGIFINDGILSPDGETYRDMDNLVKFTAIEDRTIDNNYEIKTKIEEITHGFFGDMFWGVILKPSSIFKERIKGDFIFESPPESYAQKQDFANSSDFQEGQIVITKKSPPRYSRESVKEIAGVIFLLILVPLLLLNLLLISIKKRILNKNIKKLIKIFTKILWVIIILLFIGSISVYVYSFTKQLESEHIGSPVIEVVDVEEIEKEQEIDESGFKYFPFQSSSFRTELYGRDPSLIGSSHFDYELDEKQSKEEFLAILISFISIYFFITLIKIKVIPRLKSEKKKRIAQTFLKIFWIICQAAYILLFYLFIFELTALVYIYKYLTGIPGIEVSMIISEIKSESITELIEFIFNISLYLIPLLIPLSILLKLIDKFIVPKLKSEKAKKIIKRFFRKIWKITLFITAIVVVYLIVAITFAEVRGAAENPNLPNPQQNGWSAPSQTPTILPDLDLHLHCDNGDHIGINYETGEYEIDIEGAIVSGDNSNSSEWIFISPDIGGCHYSVSSHDNQTFLEENPEIASEMEDTTDAYEIYARYIDPETAIYTSEIITEESIEAGTELEHKINGTDNIIIAPGVLIVDSPFAIKEKVKENLEEAKTGNNKIDKKINKVINNITKSLQDNLWQDETYLDPEKGKKVFGYEMAAVVKMKLYLYLSEHSNYHKLPESVILTFEQAIKDLVAVDKILAEVILDDAKNTPVNNPNYQNKFNKLIAKAEQNLEQANQYSVDNNPARAIFKYGSSWYYSQKAIKVAGE